MTECAGQMADGDVCGAGRHFLDQLASTRLALNMSTREYVFYKITSPAHTVVL